jgi:hypothetical protein
MVHVVGGAALGGLALGNLQLGALQGRGMKVDLGWREQFNAAPERDGFTGVEEGGEQTLAAGVGEKGFRLAGGGVAPRRRQESAGEMSGDVGGGDDGPRAQQGFIEHFLFVRIGQRANDAGESGLDGMSVGSEEIGQVPSHAQAAGTDFNAPIGAARQFRIVQHAGILRLAGADVN